MTVSTTTSRVAYSANGSTSAFSFPYFFLADADLVVIERVTATGVETTKTLTTDYTVTGAGSPSGGTVTFGTAPASGRTITIYRDPTLTQSVDITDNDPLPAASIETPLDRLTMIAQRLRDMVSRAVRWSDAYTGSASLTAPEPGAGYYWRWNAAGTRLEAVAAVNDPGSYTPSGTGGVARSVTSKLAEAESIVDRGAAGDGTTSDRTALANAIAAARDVLLTGTHLVDSDITIPATNTLHFHNGAKLKIAAGVTVTVNGTIEAPITQIFDCVSTGKVVFGTGSQKAVYPEWFGVVGDGSVTGTWGTGTDNETAFNKCITACQNGGLRVVTQPGAVYRIGPANAQSNSLWLWPDNMVYEFGTSTFLANVFASDWEQRTTHQTENVEIFGGVYYPIGDNTDPASPPVPATDRYIQGNNAFGVLYGKNITWWVPRAKCMKRVAGLTIQTSNVWGANPYFANIENVRVISPIIEGTANPIGGTYSCPVGILVNSVSIDNAIRHVYVTNPIVRQCYRAAVVSTGAVSNYMENINVTDLDAEDISDVGSIIVGIVHGKFTGTINGVGWQGVRSQGNAFCDIDYTIRGASTMAVPDGQTGTVCALITDNATHAVTGPNNISVRASGYAVGTPFTTGLELSSDGDHFPLLEWKWCTTGIDNNVGGTKRTAVVDTMVVKGVTTDISAPTDPKLYVGEIVNMDATSPVRTRFRPAASTGTANFGIDAGYGTTFDIAAGGTATVFGAADNFSGLLLVQETTGSSGAAVYLMSVGTSTKLGGAAAWGAAAAAATHNVYYNGSNQVTVQNTTGGAVTYRVLATRIHSVGS